MKKRGINIKNPQSEVNLQDNSNLPHVYIKNSEIMNNKICGVLVLNTFLSIENTNLQDNGDYAIHIPIEYNKNLTFYKNKNLKLFPYKGY